MKQILINLMQKYTEVFGVQTTKLHYFFSPGRVNLIGEHTDYNGGYVFPCALNCGTYAIVTKRLDNNFNVHSLNYPDWGTLSFTNLNLVLDKNHGWANYIKGVLKIMIDMGYQISHGLDILIFGDIPLNSGLSSSASIEVLMATILNNIFELNIPKIEIVKIAMAAENKFVMVNCGIMDQFAVTFGQKDQAILLNCNTLKYSYIPLKLGQYKIVIANTNVPRSLVTSKYNERRHECNTALNELKASTKIDFLCDLSATEFAQIEHLIIDKSCYMRASHIISENNRTILASEALINQNLKSFGQLMNQSHISLRDLYNVTGIHLDTLAEAAWINEACLGARMTGAGFGGCTVNLVKADAIEQFIKNVGQYYQQKTQISASFYTFETGIGAHEVILENLNAN